MPEQPPAERHDAPGSRTALTDGRDRSVAAFLLLVLLLSAVLWALDPVLGDPLGSLTGTNLPASALMFAVPGLVAVVLTWRRSGGTAVRHLLTTAGGRPRPPSPAWYLPAALLMPAVVALSYVVVRVVGRPLPEDVSVPWASVPLLLLLYLVSAFCEQLGWTSYATDPLQARRGALAAAVILGTAWALLHVVPYAQAGNDARWIAGQCLYTVALRVVLTWVYNNTGPSVLAVVTCQASSNVAWSLFPNSGSHFDPVVAGTVAAAVAGVLSLRFGARTLAR